MLSPRSRREAIEQGKAELNRLYEQLPETAYDLSLKDLVEQPRRLSFSGGLPVEERQDCSPSSPPPELLTFASANAFFFSVTSSPPRSRRHNTRISPATSFDSLSFVVTESSSNPAAAETVTAAPPGGFRPVTVKHISPRKVSPRASPPVPPRGGHRSLPGSPVWRLQKEPQVKPIFPVLNFDRANSRCSSCSAHVIFFKTKCQVCSKLYCSRCVKRALCNSKCGRGCFTSSSNNDTKNKKQGSRTCKRASSCWPFPITGIAPRPRSKSASDTANPASAQV